ncbi:ubiquitin-protein ligase / HECT2 [Leishmania donovani]|uniref:HECT-type E3 ubiquitin transferase n=3 Tax=Leishmania donovani species complex TaxID=38574 RepID=A0A6L0XVQ7_LEIIN|nr:putative ubiquitin-protein ligase [Leishmania infantum JPCM5]CAC9512677.1 ubiquitin-protein_ligase_-_putative [Leishmania infantum]CAJ1990880.1 ubiquitin-protein ligase / HECT2 [Leishmania donovani]CAM69991.1 putative ubiquitin-protein ligase [Leishmania infantum JPCM5]SUZ43911.1 ubiquitin-protein_ligase_-_putative [Leishmania infantum]VDZ46731.1 ubiquitin-protein_ligase_putative/GeneDB:LmjF.30.0910 [Leishmania donovani]|eukprot:XP_001466941.1 putative ubiquitin-protein ligase [Leishmania infantum JPCM5]
MSQFVFNGSSRMRNMKLARDHHKTRNSIIEDAQRLRLQREEEARRMRAVRRLQRAIRQWLACQAMVRLALSDLDSLSSDVKRILLSTSSAGFSSAVHTTAVPSQTEQLTARLHTACWCLSYVRRHQSHIPLRLDAPFRAAAKNDCSTETVLGDAGSGIPGTTGLGATAAAHQRVTLSSPHTSSVSSLGELRAYRQRVFWHYSECLYTALSESINRSAEGEDTADEDTIAFHADAATEAAAVNRPADPLSLSWPSFLASLPTKDVVLLLCVLLQQLSRVAPSMPGSHASPSSSASLVKRLARYLVAVIVTHNAAFARTLNEEPTPRRSHEGLEMSATAVTLPSLAAAASFDRWPAVHALTVTLSFLGQETVAHPVSVRSQCRELLQPLVAAFPPLSQAEAGGYSPLSPPTGSFAQVCWQCMCAPYTEEESQRLTSNSLAVLLGAADTAAEGPARGGCDVVDTCFTMLVAECYRRTAMNTELTACDGVSGLRGGELRARVLGRLVRLLPRIHQLVEATSCAASVSPSPLAACTDVVKWYLLSVSCLSERLCREDFFIEGILADHYAYNTGRRQQRRTVDGKDDAEGVDESSHSQYRLLTSYLFSAEGGLQLLQLLTVQDERCEKLRLMSLQKPTVEAPTDTGAPPTVDDGGNEEGDLAAAASLANTTSFMDAGAAAQWPSSASMQQSPLEILCNVFAWPIFTFSKPRYSRYQQETLALYAKLVRTPQLLRRLWSLYWQSCEGLRAVLPPGEALQRLCQPPAWGAQEQEEQPALAGEERSRRRRVPAAAHPGPALISLPRLPTWETHPRYPLAFYDPHASLSIFFFTLLAYYVNVCDFADELRRGGEAAVLSTEESWALVLALKEIVHRSHMYGVVPDSNGEAVAHAACLLLSRLHTVDEADPFVPAAATGLWMSVSAVAAEAAVGLLFRTWDAASAAVVDEEDAAEAGEAELDGASVATGERSVVGGVMSSTTAGVATTSVAHVRLPGDDVAFHGSAQWKQATRYAKMLVHTPFLFPFAARALLLSALLVETDHHWTPPSERRVVVQRGRTFIDAFDLFHDKPLSNDMLNIRFIADDGTLEAGYGRGVYRECIVSLCKEGFAAEYGLFRQTPDGYVYPNSFSAVATSDPQHLLKIRFLGAMVGRALRDGVLQDVPFALHFRNSILGRRNTLSNLKSFDAELYHQLMSLTQLSEEELEAVGLTFVYTVNALGITREVELVPDGAKMHVTPRNCLFYVHLVADFKLNREAAEQTRAFCTGLHSVIDTNRLRLFDSNEVGKLFGGDETGQIDLEDWKANTVYDKPEDVNAPQVRLFWDVVESLTRAQQRQLLKFVTSMTRPPLLGFRFLAPPFKVQLLAMNASGPDHLPSAATCFSTLKLPPYRDYATARAKIVAAIEETGTFEFS